MEKAGSDAGLWIAAP